MRYFKRAGLVIVTMILMFFIAYGGNVTFIPVAAAAAAQSAKDEAARIAAEAAAKAKIAREKAEAERKEKEAAAERARREAEEKAAAEIARIDAEIAAQSARVADVIAAEREMEAEAAAERERIEAEAAAERARIEAEAAAERARIEAEATKLKRKEAAAAVELAKKKVEDSLSLNMVFVEGGMFTMGCTTEKGKGCNKNEKPDHQVTLSDFYIGKYEVTQAQWQKVMGNNPSGSYRGDNLPVLNVSWNDVQEFIKRLNDVTGGNYRLPTEAEWEYAARGGMKSQGYKHSGSDDISVVGWYMGNTDTDSRTHPVGTKKANELGIHDMSGNVSEWVNDWFGDYNSSAQTNPKGPGPLSSSKRVIRGGDGGSLASNTRVSSRKSEEPVHRQVGRSTTDENLGFRIARSSN